MLPKVKLCRKHTFVTRLCDICPQFCTADPLTVTAAKPPTIAFVIPCYNEQAGIQHTLTCLLGDINKLKKAKAISPNSYVLLVDDGSTDRTWELIEKISNAQPKRVRALKLSRNVGHQNALLGGLLAQIGNAVISLDADLQDDMSVVLKMIDNFNGGAEIVFAVRKGALLTAALSAARRTSTIAFSIGSAQISFRTMPISA